MLFLPILRGGCTWILAGMCLCGTIETGRGVVGEGWWTQVPVLQETLP